LQTIQEFIDRSDIKEIKDNHSTGEIMSQDFFRDPLRPIYEDHDMFFASADGIVLYALDSVKPKNFLEIKGKNFTLQDLMADEDYNEESVVVGIFMTGYDVHVNRVPATSFYIGVRSTDYIYTHNISMLLAENQLLESLNYNKNALAYLKSNERKISTFYAIEHKQRYYVVQVGDRDVDVILNWGMSNCLSQGDRFGQIRFGSQCDLVIPKKKGYKYETIVKKLDHVEAGIDGVVRICHE